MNTTAGGQDAGEAAVSAAAAPRALLKGAAPAPESAHSGMINQRLEHVHVRVSSFCPFIHSEDVTLKFKTSA